MRAQHCIPKTKMVDMKTGSILVQERGCPNVLAGFVDITVLPVFGGNKRKTMVEVLSARCRHGFDDHFSCVIDVSPLTANDHRCQPLREVKGQVESGFDNSLAVATNVSLLLAELPTRQSL